MKLTRPIWLLKDWGLKQLPLNLIEGRLAVFTPLELFPELFIFTGQPRQGCRNLGKSLNIPMIKSTTPQESMDLSGSGGNSYVLNTLNLVLIYLQPITTYNMSQYLSRCNMESTLIRV